MLNLIICINNLLIINIGQSTPYSFTFLFYIHGVHFPLGCKTCIC